MRIITFLSDFGDKDWFVAAVKGEILKINKNTIIVDVTHKLSHYDIRTAAFLLKFVYKNFPKGTIHLAVVDPGVGGPRKPIIVQSEGYYFVGPDNGIFSYIYNENSKVYVIIPKRKMSSTFHARDIFGPTAAKLSKNAKPANLGVRKKKYKRFKFPKTRKKGEKLFGEVIYIDQFGNLITNIPNDCDVKESYISKRKILVRKSYGEGKQGEIICLKGSSGYYEIACNKGSVQKILKVKTEAVVSVKTRN
jgi:hypothetical protein